MKQFKIMWNVSLGYFLVMFLVVSCVRERDYDTTISDDVTIAAFIYDDAINIMNEAYSLAPNDTLVHYKTRGTCGVVSKTANSVTVDFDSLNCLCRDGRYRRGKITVEYTNNYTDTTSEHTYLFEDYFVNDVQVLGTQQITFGGTNETGNPAYSVQVDGELILADTISRHTYKADITRTHVQGAGTIVWEDDVYELTGTGMGVNQYLSNYAMNIADPLVKPVNQVCRFFNKGVVEIQPQGKTFRKTDYGDGSCDDKITVTIDGKEHDLKHF